LSSFSTALQISNFWDEVIPLFSDFNRDVWFIAGDIGAFPGMTNPVVKHIDNFHYIASGMGGYQTDNILKFSVYENGEVAISTIYLNNLIEKGKAQLYLGIREWIDNLK